MKKGTTFTEGKILKPLILFALQVSYIMSRQVNASLFDIGLATPCSSALQILLCVGFMLYLKKKAKV